MTIPKRLREAYGIEAGDEVVWVDGDEGIVVRKANGGSARGMLVPDDTPDAKRAEIAGELEHRIRDHRATIEDRLLDAVDDTDDGRDAESQSNSTQTLSIHSKSSTVRVRAGSWRALPRRTYREDHDQPNRQVAVGVDVHPWERRA